MTTKTEALKLALEALETIYASTYPYREDGSSTLSDESVQLSNKAIAKCREALAQPEQESLEYWNAVEGWVKIDEVREHFDSVGCGTIYKTAGEGRAPLYTSPNVAEPRPKREWVGLTFDEKYDLAHHEPDPYEVVKNVEIKLKELNHD